MGNPTQEELDNSVLEEFGIEPDNKTTGEETSEVTEDDTSETDESSEEQGENPDEESDTDELSEDEKKIERKLKKKYLKTISKLSAKLELKGNYDTETVEDLQSLKEATKQEIREEMEIDALFPDTPEDKERFMEFRKDFPNVTVESAYRYYLAEYEPEKLLNPQARAKLVKTPRPYTSPSVKKEVDFKTLPREEQDKLLAKLYESGDLTL